MSDEKLPYELCGHVKDNGICCGSPALAGQRFCYFHFRIRRDVMSPANPIYDLPVLDNEQSLQVAIMELMRGLLNGEISERKAAVMLSAIKTAGSILRQVDKPKEALLKEIASDLRGRLAQNKSPQPSE
jgi:hypothetical protein